MAFLTAYTNASYSPSFQFYTSSTDAVCPATTGTLSASYISGTTGPFTYNWTNNQTFASYPGNNISVPPGEYILEVTDQTTGCILSVADSFGTIVNQTSSVTASITTTPANCTNGTASALASGGLAPYSYLWVNGATSPNITGLLAGYYPLVVTDANGCQSNYLGANIQQGTILNVNAAVSNATCVQNDGSIMAFTSGGTAPYTYAWNNGQTGNTAINLAGGANYYVSVTDANGCFGGRYTYVNINTPISVTFTATPSDCIAATGSATLVASGGTPPYTYTWNTSPALSGSTITNVPPGSYPFVVTDAVGCKKAGIISINSNSTLNASVQASAVVCPSTNGTVTASVTGSNPPFTYLWNNGATTSQISGVPLGFYSCQITDALGCSVTKSKSLVSISPLNVGISTTPVSCLYSTDGTATALVSGGLAPYTYSFSNGSTLANATGLAFGNYYLTVSDANGCSRSKSFSIGNANTNTDCYCTISGKVYIDGNANCIYDLGEVGIENIRVYCSGFGSVFTNANGDYSFQVPSGNYTITEQNHPYYPLASCQNNSVSVNVVAAANCNTVVDFANDINYVNDLRITTVNSSLPPIPGNNYQQKVIVKNEGSVTESDIQVSYEHDGQLPFVSSNLLGFVQPNAGTAPNYYTSQSGFPALTPNQSSVVLINYSTPTNIPIGTFVSFEDTVANNDPVDVNWLLDESPWNNVSPYITSVIGSYDPNYKEVSPKGEGVEGFITNEVTEFNYTIHFQNEGSYFAKNIVITDQLDEDLDWESLKPIYSDYNFSTTVNETGLVTFKFENINLPWKSQYGDALSSGLITYSIQRKTTNQPGTEFTNEANIYFDYNEPIKTNVTLNTLVDTATSIINRPNENSLSDLSSVDLFPVPTKGLFTITVHKIVKNDNAKITLIDVMGNVLHSNNIALKEGTTSTSLDISNLAKGTYFVKIQYSDGSFTMKKTILY
jgi:hypothetical protein